MQSKTLVWKTIFVLAAVFILAACTAAPTAVPPTQAPTVDLRPTLGAVATQAVQTMVAEMTLNAPTATQVIPTDTPAPTNTLPPPPPTETPAPTQTPTRAFIPWTSTPTATQAAYTCTVTDVTPKSTDKITVDQDFDAKWSLKNTGTKTWQAGNTDIVFSSGTRMHTVGDLLDLTSDVAPNGTYTVTIDMKAPSSDGTHTTTWAINLEDGSTCNLTLTINVTK